VSKFLHHTKLYSKCNILLVSSLNLCPLCQWKVFFLKYSTFSSCTLNTLWRDFDRASSLICGNKMPTRCNRAFYCRSYCLLNMFRAPLCPSSGAQEYYTVVAACGVRFARHITLSSTPDQQLENHSAKYHRQQPLYNTLELLMIGIVVPETCLPSNKICSKNLCCI